MDHDVENAFQRLETEDEPSIGQSVLRPMVLSLIHSSYLRTRTLADFAHDVVDIVGSAVTVPFAFAEGFLRAFLAIESVEEDSEGRVVIRPKKGASEEEIIREVDELSARIDPSAVFNPVVRRQLDMVADATSTVMRQDLDALADLSPGELTSALRDLESEVPESTEGASSAAEEVRARIEDVRRTLRNYQARSRDLTP